MGRDYDQAFLTSTVANFNSHARVGRDLSCKLVSDSRLHFNSHARVGRDVLKNVYQHTFDSISTHTPAWGVTELLPFLFYDIHISTHTPAWGVTPQKMPKIKTLPISTHTPAWGVTYDQEFLTSTVANFN